MNPVIKLVDCEILEADSRDYTKDGKQRTFRQILFRYSGKILKMGLTTEAVFADFKKAADESTLVDLTCELVTWGDQLEPTLRAQSLKN